MIEQGNDHRRRDAVKTLLRVRDLELRKAEEALQAQQRRVSALEGNVLRLRERCERLDTTSTDSVIENRRALEALIRTKLAIRAELECARREAADLLPAVHGAQGRRDAVFRLWSRRRLEDEIESERRQEAALADLAARKLTLRRHRSEGWR